MDRRQGNLPHIPDLDCAKLANSSDSNDRQHVNSSGGVENADASNSVQHSSLLPRVRGFTSRPRCSTDFHSTNGLRNSKEHSSVLHREDHDDRFAIVDLRGSFVLGHIGYFSRKTSRHKTALEI